MESSWLDDKGEKIWNRGLGKQEKAKEFFRKALAIEPSHMQCTLYLSNLES